MERKKGRTDMALPSLFLLHEGAFNFCSYWWLRNYVCVQTLGPIFWCFEEVMELWIDCTEKKVCQSDAVNSRMNNCENRLHRYHTENVQHMQLSTYFIILKIIPLEKCAWSLPVPAEQNYNVLLWSYLAFSYIFPFS